MEEIKQLEQKYKPVIQKIIDDNKKFYGFEQTVEWDFFTNEKVAVFGMASSDLKLHINIYSVDFAFTRNEPLQIECFILHEIRHIYQRLSVLNCRQNNIEDYLAMQWEKELSNYISMEQDVNAYFNQYLEFDAFCYSYAIMLYKYGKVPYIDYPEFYHSNDEFDCMVTKWLEVFKSRNF